ncbi:hypothetical protein PG994_004391 [Apiospora phragmitis]|uniref:Ankyrin repeat protein n=1 Tax=Apiospora phragmitis TaxID=2905665 RepID=A0ABR1VRM4_9PEZI
MAVNGSAITPEISDIWEDCQWKSPNSTVEDYQNKPWANCRDAQQAYLGARFNKRSEFLGNLDSDDRAKIQHELERIAKVRRRFPTDEKKQALVNSLKDTLHDWRKCVSDNKEAMMEEIKGGWLRRGYTTNILERGRGELRRRGYTANKLERDRGILQRCNASEPSAAGATNQLAVINGRSKRRPSLSMIEKLRGPKIAAKQASKRPPITEEVDNEKLDEPEPLYGLKASAMYFKKVEGEESAWSGWTHDHSGYGGSKFPNQKIAMNKILEDTEDNPLMEQCPENCIRGEIKPQVLNMAELPLLIHRSLQQKAIARYYNEEPEPLNDRHYAFSPDGRKTEKLLSREFWHGQMHGSSAYGSNPRTQLGNASYPAEDWTRKGGPIHARHMRSNCAIIPRDTTTTHRTHPQIPSAAVPHEGQSSSHHNSLPDRISPKDKNVALFLPYMHWRTSSRRAKMVQVINETIGYKKKDPDLLDVTMKKIRATKTSKVTTESKPWRKFLATYLFTLAQVAEQMDYEADERLLRDYVKADPPLHIRRTLDQYYFVTLDDTSDRDKDQVVYRGTLDKTKNRTQRRVVMVDQLWLWILDDNTIITSFPRRWGRNKPDPSGVHKSLRERFGARPEDIKSVHHLALIIIDQCSRVFFDRVKPLDQRPEVMDIFASAIAHVDQMTAVAYDTFWRHTKLYSQNMLPKAIGTKYLDINPEGALLKEAQDIAEELKMMKRIYNDQLKVVKDFKRHLIHPQGRRAEKADAASKIQKILEDLMESRDNKEEADDEEYDGTETPKRKQGQSTHQVADETLHEAEGVLELVKSRRGEIMELEQSAMHTCRQLEGFLTLKQQQASIVEAKAALERAEESVKQGRAIMAFTIVTIFFLPLGFFAAFFGMNNDDINEAKWMTLNDQIKWMFALSTVVITLSTSIAFYPTMRPFLIPIIAPSQVIYNILRELRSPKAPPDPQKEQEDLGKPESTVKFMEIFAWLPKGRLRAPKKGANGFLPHIASQTRKQSETISFQQIKAYGAITMHFSASVAVFGLYLTSGALAAIIAPEVQPRATAAVPTSEVIPGAAAATAPTDPVDPCAPDPFCDPAWPVGSVSVLTDTAAGVCTPVLSTRFYSHVCGRTTWTTSTMVTSTADCGACSLGTGVDGTAAVMAPLSLTYYVPRCPLGGHHTVSTAVVPSTRTTWACAATTATP